MLRTFRTATLATILATAATPLTGIAAHAFEPVDVRPFSHVTDIAEPLAVAQSSLLPRSAKIAVARVELGRLIPMPWAEGERWSDVTRRTGDRYVPLPAGAYLEAVPGIPFHGHDTDNKLDEMRLAAVDQGFDYLLVYGFGEDARNGFARRSADRTGWVLPERSALDEDGDAKAVLVDTRTGRVLGAVTDGKPDRFISTLSDRVGDMVTAL